MIFSLNYFYLKNKTLLYNFLKGKKMHEINILITVFGITVAYLGLFAVYELSLNRKKDTKKNKN